MIAQTTLERTVDVQFWYLAHPSKDRHKVLQIEQKIEHNTNFNLLNPFYEGYGKKFMEQVDSGEYGVYDNRFNHKELVETDLETLSSCAGVLGIIVKSESIGTYMELMYAHLHHIPIILIIYPDEIRTHPWLKYTTKLIFKHEDEFIEFAGDKNGT